MGNLDRRWSGVVDCGIRNRAREEPEEACLVTI